MIPKVFCCLLLISAISAISAQLVDRMTVKSPYDESDETFIHNLLHNIVYRYGNLPITDILVAAGDQNAIKMKRAIEEIEADSLQEKTGTAISESETEYAPDDHSLTGAIGNITTGNTDVTDSTAVSYLVLNSSANAASSIESFGNSTDDIGFIINTNGSANDTIESGNTEATKVSDTTMTTTTFANPEELLDVAINYSGDNSTEITATGVTSNNELVDNSTESATVDVDESNDSDNSTENTTPDVTSNDELVDNSTESATVDVVESNDYDNSTENTITGVTSNNELVDNSTESATVDVAESNDSDNSTENTTTGVTSNDELVDNSTESATVDVAESNDSDNSTENTTTGVTSNDELVDNSTESATVDVAESNDSDNSTENTTTGVTSNDELVDNSTESATVDVAESNDSDNSTENTTTGVTSNDELVDNSTESATVEVAESNDSDNSTQNTTAVTSNDELVDNTTIVSVAGGYDLVDNSTQNVTSGTEMSNGSNDLVNTSIENTTTSIKPEVGYDNMTEHSFDRIESAYNASLNNNLTTTDAPADIENPLSQATSTPDSVTFDADLDTTSPMDGVSLEGRTSSSNESTDLGNSTVTTGNNTYWNGTKDSVPKVIESSTHRRFLITVWVMAFTAVLMCAAAKLTCFKRPRGRLQPNNRRLLLTTIPEGEEGQVLIELRRVTVVPAAKPNGALKNGPAAAHESDEEEGRPLVVQTEASCHAAEADADATDADTTDAAEPDAAADAREVGAVAGYVDERDPVVRGFLPADPTVPYPRVSLGLIDPPKEPTPLDNDSLVLDPLEVLERETDVFGYIDEDF